MSYRNPKYTYVSSQPAFDKLTDSIVGAAQTISAKKEKALEDDKKKGEALAQAGQGAAKAGGCAHRVGCTHDGMERSTVGPRKTMLLR